jgi:Zn-dependent protease
VSARAHFKIAGIPVHVQPVFFVISGLFGLRYIDENVLLLPIWMATTFVSILVHELGHGVALKVFGQPSAIVLHGFGGVTISQRRAALSRARGIAVSLAGSLTALALLWYPARTALGSDWGVEQLIDYALSGAEDINWWRPLQFLAFQNLWWSVANLLPIRPLDGGNVTAELFGMPRARRISVGVAIGAAVWAFTEGQTYAAFFALFLAFNNYQEIRAEQSGGEVDAFEVEAPDAAGGARPSRRGRGHLRAVPPSAPAMAPPPGPTMQASDPARIEQQAWAALRAGDAAAAARLTAAAGSKALNPYLTASVALATGDSSAFELFEQAYVAQPSGPPNLVATEVLARSGAAAAVAKRLVARPDGAGREGAANLQTHLHYGDRFAEAAEVGEAVFAATPASPAQTAFEVACSWARAGDVERAASWLDRAADAGFRAATIVDGEPDLATVREHPRWPLLRARLV